VTSPSRLEIVPLAGRFTEWDRFIEKDPASTFCHRAGWHDVMANVMGQSCEYLVAQRPGGEWAGVLPLVHVRGLVGHYLVSMPYVDDGGPLGDDAAREALATEAQAIAKKSGAKLLELRSRVNVSGPVETNARKVSVQLPMPGTVDDLWAKTFKAKLRSQVRRPAKEGMTARTGPSELDAFYHVFTRNMRDLGTPVLPRRFFERLVELWGESVVITGVYTTSGEPAAGSCSFAWNGELYVTWASSIRAFNKLSPNMLLYSSMMETAIQRGLTKFNFGRSTPGASTHKFKQQWGGVDVPLPWASWSPSGAGGTPTPDKPIFKVATAVWSKLPLPIANGLGPFLARQLP
jgi:FemAB-related protein (PEP-CTERM system-associated)